MDALPSPVSAEKPKDFIHYSQISTFLTCRKRHDLAYVERLEPRKYQERMSRGTVGHAVLEDLWRGGPWTRFDAVVSELLEKQEAGLLDEDTNVHQMAAEIKAVAVRAFDKLAERYEILDDHIEKSLIVNVEVFPGNKTVPFGGTPDAVVRDRRDGTIWILDYKFRGSFLAPESELLNLQMIVYSWLLRETHGFLPTGSRQVQITPNLPKEPKLNKNGTMSRADLKTDWETYSNALIRNGLDPKEYEEMREKLANKVFVDIDSCRAYRSEEEIDFHVRTEVLPAIHTIATRKAHGGRCYNALLCGACSYRELCVEEAKGGDVDFIKNTLYKIRGTVDAPVFVLEEDV